MGKQKRKEHQTQIKKNKWDKTCERCGNESFVPGAKSWTCKYCGFRNEVDKCSEF